MLKLLVCPSQQEHPRGWRCKRESWSLACSCARLCVCSGRGEGDDFSPDAAELSASVIRAREKRTGEDIRWVNLSESLCARRLFAATASDRLSSDWFPAKLHTCWCRGTRWHCCFFPLQEEINSRRSPRTQRWQPSLFLLEITETRIPLLRRIRSSWAFWRRIPWDTGWIRLSWHCCWEWWVALLCGWTWIWLGWILAGVSVPQLGIHAHQQSLGISGRGSGQFWRGQSLWETFNKFLLIIIDSIVADVFGTPTITHGTPPPPK